MVVVRITLKLDYQTYSWINEIEMFTKYALRLESERKDTNKYYKKIINYIIANLPFAKFNSNTG